MSSAGRLDRLGLQFPQLEPNRDSNGEDIRKRRPRGAVRSPRAHYCPNSAGLPVKRSILLAVGGCVENRLPKLIPPRKG